MFVECWIKYTFKVAINREKFIWKIKWLALWVLLYYTYIH